MNATTCQKISRGTRLVVLLFSVWMALSLTMISTASGENSISQEAWDDFDDGFDDEGMDPFASIDTRIPETAVGRASDPGPIRFNGFIELSSQYRVNRDDEPLSKLESLLHVESEYTITPDVKARISGEFAYDASYDLESKQSNRPYNQDDDEVAMALKDVLIDGRLTKVFSVKVGRQIVAWGDSDYARITDVVNPRDLTAPGLIDLEDARLPVTAIRLTAQTSVWTMDAVTIHEHPGSKISGLGWDFDYFKALRSPSVTIHNKDTPDVNLENTGFVLKASRAFNGGHVSFVGASTYDDQPYLDYNGLAGGHMVFTPVYDRVTTYGVSGTLARGSVLYKTEAALKHDKPVLRTDIVDQVLSGLPEGQVKTVNTEDQYEALVGMEYTGFSDVRLNLETQVIHTPGAGKELSIHETQRLTYVQATKTMMNERLELDLFWLITHPGHGTMLRLSATYDLFDGFELKTGVIAYDADNEDASMYAYKDQDRVFIQAKYSF